MSSYKVLDFGADHVHVLTHRHGHIQESCMLHPNWDRCTAEPADLDVYRGLPRGGNRDVWMRVEGGDRYVKAPIPDEFYDCSDCTR